MDVLSDVLRTVRLTGSIFFTANFFEPWSVLAPSQEELLQKMPSNPECISFFHIVTEGQCRFKTLDGKPFLLYEGDIIIFPHSCPHIMGSNIEMRPTPALQLNVFENSVRFSDVKYGGNGDKTQFICGYLLCDQRFNPLLGALPEVLILSSQKDRLKEENPELEHNTLHIESNSWIAGNMTRLVEEVIGKSEGSITIATRLTELMYVEVLRRYMQELPEESHGWLAAVRDYEVGKALNFLHAHPEKKWNVKKLAAKVGVSRSAFAERFTNLIGEPPMTYLTHWRIQLAKSLLHQPELSLAMVAERVGYESDTAFSRAFKRYVGEPPVQWKQRAIK